MAGKIGGKKLLLVGGILLTFLLGAAGGYFAYSKFMPKPPTSPAAVKIVNYDLGEFVTNLADVDRGRYIKIKLVADVTGEEAVKELTKKNYMVRDAILTVLRSKTVADLSGEQGKANLTKELIARLNELIDTGKIKNLYFVDFVIS